MKDLKLRKAVLRAKNILKTYDQTEILKGVNLSLAAGEWLAILGESGSGKSTLLSILGRLKDASSGTVYFDEEALPPVSHALIPGHESIRLIHQEFELFPNQTVFENIAYSLRFYDPEYRQQQVEYLLNITGLTHLQNKKSKLLSGGEKQRTAIAKALAEQPAVLLLDEPFAHLDNHNKRVLSDAIAKLKDQLQMACIFVTHEASNALAWSDRIVIIKEGNIIQEGSPQEVYNHPINSYVAELTGDINWLMDEHGVKRQYIRPERLKRIQNEAKSKWKGQVTSIRFHGHHWEIECQDGLQTLSFYSSKVDVVVGETVMLTYAAQDLKTV
jgi:ABC-type Fe3+/spermidine/putrescine transport system ATPase subunit